MNNRARVGFIAAVDALLLAVGVVGVVTVGSGGSPSAATVSAGATTTTAAVAATVATVPAAPAAATAAPAGGAAATAKPKKGAATVTPAQGAAAASTGAFHPPKDGSYRRKLHTESDGMEKKTSDSELTLTYTTVKSSPAETEQKVAIKSDKANMSGDSSFLWRPDGVFARVGAASGGKVTCTPAEQTVMKLPLAVGVTWTNIVDCTFDTGQGSGSSHSETMQKVVGSKTVQVAGRSVQVWEIAGTSTNKGSFGGRSSEGTGTSTQLFSAEHGLAVHEETTSKGDAGGLTFTAKSVSDLLNLDPAAS
jgi:hypothetical protein